MLKDGLYHHSIFLPEEIKPTGKILPHYTSHAREQARKDRYGEINLPDVIDLDSMRIDEIEVKDGKAIKIVCRKPLDLWRDMTFVLVPFSRKVITTWSNMKHDHHSSVDLEKYVKPY